MIDSLLDLTKSVPELFIIGGPNGAGKTTTALSVFPRLGITEFVNADAIAAGLSPLNPEGQARAAGRLMLERLDELSRAGENFALETTLASRSFAPFARECQERGYTFNLIYVWVEDADLAVRRVATRVRAGGHNIPEEIIRRRYGRGLSNFFQLYIPLADTWTAIDNTQAESQTIARGGREILTEMFLPARWEEMQRVLNND